MDDTIFALSSGAPPAAIGIVRISGPQAAFALEEIAGAGASGVPRETSLRTLRDGDGRELDRALTIFFAGPLTVTGEDLAELHCHGGRAVIAAVEKALGALPGLRRAEPGEFTRRAFANGKIDLAEAEGLADLLAAETEIQRVSALQTVGGAVSRQVADWRNWVLAISAEVESVLDFADEDDVTPSETFDARVRSLVRELREWLERPSVETLREGYRVALAGPPNAGKSTLYNALLQRDAAIVSNVAGTTRDVLEAPVAWDGIPFTLVDMAGIREETSDEVEAVGVTRANSAIAHADCVLWLGPEGSGPDGAIEVAARCDDPEAPGKSPNVLRVSAQTGQGLSELTALLTERAQRAMPKPGQAVLNARQRGLVEEAHKALTETLVFDDWILKGEGLRQARLAFDRMLGATSTEDMLDTLFGRFCIGK